MQVDFEGRIGQFIADHKAEIETIKQQLAINFDCQRCMDTVLDYMYYPLWQFTVIESRKESK